MAMTECKECGNEVSTKAAACPKCGARPVKTHLAFKVIGGVLVLLFLITLIPTHKDEPAATSPNAPQDVATDAPAAVQVSSPALVETKPARLVAEQIVRFDDSSFACISKDKFDEAVQHAVRNEKTKLAGMFENFDCLPIPENVDFKVLSVVEDHDKYAIIEITNAKNTNQPNGLITEWDYK